MRETLLIIGHGSRNADGNAEIESFAANWRARHPDWRIDVCFIELADVLMDAGLDRAAQGSDRVLVLPLILNAAGHVKMEIPEAIEQARLRHPNVEFRCGRHLGMGEDMLAILKDSLHKVMRDLDVPDPRTTGVILLGRGSSDAGANGELAKMARWVYEATDHDLVDIAFTGITHPRLESIVQRHARLGMTQIAVLPVYLFTGVLIERIKRQVERLSRVYPNVAIGLGHYIGFDEAIYRLLDERVAKLRTDQAVRAMLECDGCRFRASAHKCAHDVVGHDHHHHH
jgi:sirohydrochlorin cobaltochelatase